jgi:hypothetical protein
MDSPVGRSDRPHQAEEFAAEGHSYAMTDDEGNVVVIDLSKP